jgi:unsaturated rhamnogalacturonyl hydrolase
MRGAQADGTNSMATVRKAVWLIALFVFALFAQPETRAHPTTVPSAIWVTGQTSPARQTCATCPTWQARETRAIRSSNVVPAQPGEVAADLRGVAALPGEPHILSAAGVTRDESPILTIENPSAFDVNSRLLRVALVGGPSGDPRAVLDAVRWFKTRAPRTVRERWAVSALPSASFEDADTLSLPRWVTFQAPDLVVTVGSVVLDVSAPVESIAVENAADAFAKLLGAPRQRSPLHATLAARIEREPLAIARLLARRYPETPAISYIPALAWVETLRLAAMVNDDTLREKVVAQTRPWVDGEKKLFPPPQASSGSTATRIQLTSVAGTMIFDELHAHAPFEEGLAAAAKQKAPGEPEYGQGWTDDMFMATSVLSRSPRAEDHDMAARLLTTYASRLQQPSGLFNHAVNGPAAWGRGNGFAALGLVEALTRMPAHPAHRALLEIYRRQMAAVRANQAPDGSWRQIIDEPGAYREETATAMLAAAMARGIRSGWLDGSYRAAVDRAWHALAAHVAEDGTLIDVCAGTGAGPTRRYYFDRPAVTGADDRGGAMALLASMEVIALRSR